MANSLPVKVWKEINWKITFIIKFRCMGESSELLISPYSTVDTYSSWHVHHQKKVTCSLNETSDVWMHDWTGIGMLHKQNRIQLSMGMMQWSILWFLLKSCTHGHCHHQLRRRQYIRVPNCLLFWKQGCDQFKWLCDHLRSFALPDRLASAELGVANGPPNSKWRSPLVLSSELLISCCISFISIRSH